MNPEMVKVDLLVVLFSFGLFVDRNYDFDGVMDFYDGVLILFVF